MNDDWQAAQYRDECERLRSVIEALEAAEKAGTPKDQIQLLAFESGVLQQWRQHESQ